MAPSWRGGAGAPQGAKLGGRRGAGVRAGPTRGRRFPTRFPRVHRAAWRYASAAKRFLTPPPRVPGEGRGHEHGRARMSRPVRSASVQGARESIASARATFSSEIEPGTSSARPVDIWRRFQQFRLELRKIGVAAEKTGSARATASTPGAMRRRPHGPRQWAASSAGDSLHADAEPPVRRFESAHPGSAGHQLRELARKVSASLD